VLGADAFHGHSLGMFPTSGWRKKLAAELALAASQGLAGSSSSLRRTGPSHPTPVEML